MMSDPTVKQRTPRRRLAPSEQYEMFVAVLSSARSGEPAARWDVDRTTVPRHGRCHSFKTLLWRARMLAS